MYQTLEIFPGITLRCIRDHRFKQGALSIQFLRPMARSEAAKNALLPAVLLRGCESCPDLKQITHRLDDLYGASIGTLVRRIGDYQTTGFYCGFMEDRFALDGDRILEPMVAFIGELLLQPVLTGGGFHPEFVESEKRNLIAAIESQRSDKRAYAAGRLLEIMCQQDSFGIPRLGEPEQVQEIDPHSLYRHYQTILSESPLELFYVGAASIDAVADAVRPIFASLHRNIVKLPPQTPFQNSSGRDETEMMDVAQGKLSLGYYTPITNQDSRFAAMQMCNAIFGSGMTSKLFMQVREKLSLCYAIGSSYYGSKGILTVNAGIDSHQEAAAREAIAQQLAACQNGDISQSELLSARESILSSLRSVCDSPGAMEAFFGVSALSGLSRTLEQYAEEIRAVTIQDVAEAAQTVQLHSSFFLKGDSHE